MTLELVDDVYEAFVLDLSPSLAPHARGLAHALKLVPVEGIPWSRVFGHEVTLAAPALFAEAMPEMDPRAVRDAVAAQTFAAIEAFGTDRIEDGQVEVTPTLRAVIGEVRRARNEALARVLGRETARADMDFDLAQSRTLSAIGEERRIFTEDVPVSFVTYEEVSLGKQSVGFPPTLALVHRAGWDALKVDAVTDALASIWLGLQMPDDVVDWQDDLSRGGAWAYALAKWSDPEIERAADLESRIFATGVLPRILERGAWHFARLERIATLLGARRLAVWAGDRRAHTETMAIHEAQSAGYASRAFQLIGWRTEVLA